MYKQEEICPSCDRQFIVLFEDEDDNIHYCPFCSHPTNLSSLDHLSDSEEE